MRRAWGPTDRWTLNLARRLEGGPCAAPRAGALSVLRQNLQPSQSAQWRWAGARGVRHPCQNFGRVQILEWDIRGLMNVECIFIHRQFI